MFDKALVSQHTFHHGPIQSRIMVKKLLLDPGIRSSHLFHCGSKRFVWFKSRWMDVGPIPTFDMNELELGK